MTHCDDSGVSSVNTENQRTQFVDLEDDFAPQVDVNMECGFGKCRPRFLQIFANPITFMIVLNIYCFLEGAIATGEPYSYIASYII